MALELSFACPLPNGLHARPASHLAEEAGQYVCDVALLNRRTGILANAKSVLELVGADVLFQDRCSMTFAGPDEAAAWRELGRFVKQELPRLDEPLPEPQVLSQVRSLPRMLRGAAAACWPGTPASPGIGRGRVVLAQALALPAQIPTAQPDGPAAERDKIARAIHGAKNRLESRLAGPLERVQAEILRAHLSILTDPALAQQMLERVDRQGASAAQAIVESARATQARLGQSTSDYLRERAIDVQEICLGMLRELYGDAIGWPGRIDLDVPSILVAENLSPQQLLNLDRSRLRGIVLGHGGLASHAVILARSMGIPMLVGMPDALGQVAPGREVIVDAHLGVLVVELTDSVRRYYELEDRRLTARQKRLEEVASHPGRTADGVPLAVMANVGSAQEVAVAMAAGADGVGLFRTEMLLLSMSMAPTEADQYAIFADAVRAAAGRPITFRILDVGGDKALKWLELAQETNPFLGYRGVRIYAEFADLFDTQVRAILRASALGPVRIMAPMIANTAEAAWVRKRIGRIAADLEAQGVAGASAAPVGMMVEVPSAAFAMGDLARHASFFSLGTNDLSQYFFAADRDNARVGALCDVHHPAFLRCLKLICDSARAAGRRISMCGEMAGDPEKLPILVGLGLDEISLAGAQIPAMKDRLGELASADCRELLAAAMACSEAGEVRELLARFRSRPIQRPLVDPELIVLDSDCASREEAVKRAVDLLAITERTRSADDLEQAVWAREAVYSTGLGFEFALPHAKTDHVLASSICLLRLASPIAWKPGDAPCVRLVILLAIRESEAGAAHMKVLATLARGLMDESFRQRLLEAPTPAAAAVCLETQLAK